MRGPDPRVLRSSQVLVLLRDEVDPRIPLLRLMLAEDTLQSLHRVHHFLLGEHLLRELFKILSFSFLGVLVFDLTDESAPVLWPFADLLFAMVDQARINLKGALVARGAHGPVTLQAIVTRLLLWHFDAEATFGQLWQQSLQASVRIFRRMGHSMLA